jgi:hypothetical protein
MILHELKGEIKKCIEDQNGNHVIQKLIERLPKGQHGDILKVIKGKVYIYIKKVLRTFNSSIWM